MPVVFSKAEQTKNMIAGKAKEVFCLKGYFQASMEDICAHAGVSKGSVYYHFKSKADLFIYILEQFVEDWLIKWQEKSRGITSAKNKLYALAEHYASDYESPLTQATTEFAGSESADPGVKEKLNELNGRYIPVVQAIITEGVRNQEFKAIDVDDLTLVTFGYLAGIGAVCQMVSTTEITKIHKLATDIFLTGLGS